MNKENEQENGVKNNIKKNKAWCYVLYYLLVYVLLTVFYGIAQKNLICTDIDAVCTFNEEKLISFLTIVAYILTPIVAIIGFYNWEEQHNQSIDSKYYNQALENFKGVSNSVNALKRLHEEYSYFPTENEPSIEDFKKKYIIIRKEFLDNMAKFQGDVIFLQSLSQDNHVKSTLYKFYKEYIHVAKDALTRDCIHLNFYNSYTDHEKFKNDLYNISELQGSLIIKKLEYITQFLNSKIKA